MNLYTWQSIVGWYVYFLVLVLLAQIKSIIAKSIIRTVCTTGVLPIQC